MCHETTSIALNKLIGAPVGTTVFEDFAKCNARRAGEKEGNGCLKREATPSSGGAAVS
jgi:hypothetical protein